jgi:hypothetical protein
MPDREQAGLAADVPACLRPLDDDRITANLRRRVCLALGTYLPERERPAAVDELDQRAVGLTVEELDNARPGDGRRHRVPVEERHEEVDGAGSTARCSPPPA